MTTAAKKLESESRTVELRHANRRFDVERVRRDFPILATLVHGKPLVYLDNGATSQKPQAVIDAVSHYYASTNANIHRGVHYLSGEATDAYDKARITVHDGQILKAGKLVVVKLTIA